jgi:hypothetical protein
VTCQIVHLSIGDCQTATSDPTYNLPLSICVRSSTSPVAVGTAALSELCAGVTIPRAATVLGT